MSDIPARLSSALADRYRIERRLGEGGMATVYLADDLKHDRQVAVKVLRPELAAVLGAERFVQEIKTTASLQHPHILPLYDSGSVSGSESGSTEFLFYVMPYIQGETLREKLNRETQLGIEEAVGIATSVADALDYAHRSGVIHRDIKPENILLHDGRAMVADFGIALAVSAAAGGRMTETGLSLGTPHYMSPEQATAEKELSARSDVYSLGSVLYELLTGEPPHMGNSAQQIIMKIVTDTARPVSDLRKAVPPHVAAATAKALEKLPADRFGTAAEFAAALRNPAFTAPTHVTAAVAAARRRNAVIVPALSVAVVALAVLAGWGWMQRPADPPRNVQRFADPFAEGQELRYTGGAGFGLSRDGSVLAYRHVVGGRQIVVTRAWSDLASQPVRDTEGAAYPSPSPDGAELAFGQDGSIKVLAFAGGPVRTLMDASRPVWGTDGYVYGSSEGSVLRVPAGGGVIDTVLRPTDGRAYTLRDVLPDGRHGLLDEQGGTGEEIAVVELGSGTVRTLIPYGEDPTYARSGHLLFLTDDGDLMAVGFDPGKGEVRGTPVPVIQDVAYFRLADDGTLFYSVGAGTAAQSQLVWISPTGAATPVDPAWEMTAGSFTRGFDLSLSPDGARLAVREETSSGLDIWVKRLDAGPRERLTFDPADDWGPSWRPPDGRTLSFISDRAGNGDVWMRAADGTGEATLLLDMEDAIGQAVWSPDGAWLVVNVENDLWTFRPDVDSLPRELVATPASERNVHVSPDGRWIAYQSDETGTWEVYVRPFPDVQGGKWQVSAGGGRGPRWAPDGRRLYFYLNGELRAVDVESGSGSSFVYGNPVTLFETDRREWRVGFSGGLYFDVAPSGDRFIGAAIVQREATQGQRTVLVNNFFSLLDIVP